VIGQKKLEIVKEEKVQQYDIDRKLSAKKKSKL
jgi:hypothetical protein